MNRKTVIIATLLIALSGLTSCTRQQIAAALALHEQQQAEATAAPTVTATVDCNTFSFTVSGYPEGTDVFIEIASEPPRGFTVGGDSRGFTPIAGGAAGTLPIPVYWSTQVFGATIDITVDGENVRAFDQSVDCTAPNI